MTTHNPHGRRTAQDRRRPRHAHPGCRENDRQPPAFEKYFPHETLRTRCPEAVQATQTAGKYDCRVTVEGGGPTGQAGAISLGIARALVALNEEHSRAPSRRAHDPRPPHGRTEEVRPEEGPQEIPVLQALIAVAVNTHTSGLRGSVLAFGGNPGGR